MSPWVKISDSYRDDVRLARVSTDAEAIFFRLLACSNRTLADGWLHEVIVRQEAAARLTSREAVDEALRALLTVGLLEIDEEGYRLARDFVAQQPSREDVERRREMWKEKIAEQRRRARVEARSANVASFIADVPKRKRRRGGIPS